jgi:hypothetical protein
MKAEHRGTEVLRSIYVGLIGGARQHTGSRRVTASGGGAHQSGLGMMELEAVERQGRGEAMQCRAALQRRHR